MFVVLSEAIRFFILYIKSIYQDLVCWKRNHNNAGGEYIFKEI
jgi:hypothetical protein